MKLSIALNNDLITNEMTELKNDKEITEFVRTYQSFVFNTAFRFLNSYEDAQDASQDSFIKAIKSLNSFRGESSVKTWLYHITRNTCFNYLKKRKIKAIFSFQNNSDSSDDLEIKDDYYRPDEKFENQELQNKFLDAVNKLPEKQRETFALRYYDDLPYNEISKLIGTSIGGLKANYFQAVKKIAEELKEYKDK